MSIKFDGIKTRDEILADLKKEIEIFGFKLRLAVIWIGDDTVSSRYIEQKERAAERIGVHFDIIKFSSRATNREVIDKIEELNEDKSVSGIMIQLPLPEKFDRNLLIEEIAPEKDVDGLHFCLSHSCQFRPPVTEAILKAIEISKIDLIKKKVVVIGRGFLVGEPIIRILSDESVDLQIVDENIPYIGTVTLEADLIISATGKPGIVKPEIIKDGVYLIDAGTTELDGKLVGDIDPKCYEKAGFYTPTPGGIGPVTVAMLYKNLLKLAKVNEKLISK